jgi:hypothetical protein
MSEERERAEANELREYLRLPEGGVSTRALIALAMQDKGASTYDLEYAEALMRSNGWLPPEERAMEYEIHGLCPGHPIAHHPAATCAHCNMSRVTLDKLRAALSTLPAGEPEGERIEGWARPYLTGYGLDPTVFVVGERTRNSRPCTLILRAPADQEEGL